MRDELLDKLMRRTEIKEMLNARVNTYKARKSAWDKKQASIKKQIRNFRKEYILIDTELDDDIRKEFNKNKQFKKK